MADMRPRVMSIVVGLPKAALYAAVIIHQLYLSTFAKVRCVSVQVPVLLHLHIFSLFAQAVFLCRPVHKPIL
jgi:hypothetical protein